MNGKPYDERSKKDNPDYRECGLARVVGMVEQVKEAIRCPNHQANNN
jgi:hypothetical protein